MELVAMFRKIFMLGTLLVGIFAELPSSGPYAPSGWRPQGSSFDLPNEYFAPQRESGIQLEITKERVDYAGQLAANNAMQLDPNTGYLPPSPYNPEEASGPSGIDILQVQGLPSRPSTQFNFFPSSRLNTREYYPQRQTAQIQRQQKNRNNFRQQGFSRIILATVKAPSTQYDSPIVKPSANQYDAPVVPPSTQYGVPELESVGYPEPRNPNENEELNVTEGEYYVLTPEKTLQKVSYKTSQTEEEAQVNGFTAQLKYTPVEKVNGPLYKYNEQGQLVRIYKK